VVAEMATHVAVMYLGRVVEQAPVDAIFHAPKHPYTRALLRSIPRMRARSRERLIPIAGAVPHPYDRPTGCPFHPRCPNAFEVCGWESRDLRTLLEERWTRMPEDRYEAERATIGDLDSLAVSASEARLAAAPGRTGADVVEIIDRWRGEVPDDPFWKGVADVWADADEAVIPFHEGIEPRNLEVERAEVRCHLYDDEVLDRVREEGGRTT